MARPSKPMAKNSNSRFTPRNNKHDIFSKISKASKQKSDIKTQASEDGKENPEQQD